MQPSQISIQLVADEQVFDNRHHFRAAQRVIATPPAFEIQKAFGFGVDIGQKIGVFFPDRFFRLQAFEILRQPGAIEPSIAQIAHQVRQPGPAQQATGYAHRVHAIFSCPIGQRRAVQNHRSRQAFTIGGQQCYRPARLTVAVEYRRLSRVKLGDFLNEAAQRVQHVRQRLAGHRFGKEHHEIDRMALVHRHAYLAVAFEPAYAGAMPGARINDDYRRFFGVETVDKTVVIDLGDLQQGIVRRSVKPARIQHSLILEIQQRWHSGPFMVAHVVDALPQSVKEQDRTLPEILVVGNWRSYGRCR